VGHEIAQFCGICSNTSLTPILPEVSMSLAVTTSIGLVLLTFGNAMREPVTMISVRPVSAPAAAGVLCHSATGAIPAMRLIASKACAARRDKYPMCDPQML
jgi:hypothetical protein